LHAETIPSPSWVARARAVCEGRRMPNKDGTYKTDAELWGNTDELMRAMDFLESLLPPDADPIHRERLEQIRHRLGRTGHLLVCG
jgi:hypothetical protein